MIERITVRGPEDVAGIMREAGSQWEKIVADSLTSALSHSLRTKVMERVPRSNPHVHPEYRNPSHERYHPIAGAANLAKDFEIKLIRISQGDVSVQVGFPNVEYAASVHEMQDPTRSGRPVRWSTPGTGNKYLEGPVIETADTVLQDMNKNVEAQLRRIRA